MNLRLLLISTLAALILVACAAKDESKPTDPQTTEDRNVGEKVIYGDDDRKDIYDVQDPRWTQIAKSTVALLKSTGLSSGGSSNASNISITTGGSFGNQMGLCAAEPFFSQPAAAFCSGSLVAEDIVITAGHCVRSTTDCANTRFVFDYAVLAPGKFPNSTTAENVYSCREILRREEQGAGADYAVIRLDRRVQGRTPLRIRRTGQPETGDGLTVIGHPSGLPTKIASGGQIRSATATHYVTNLDTYGGNSGSAVFNSVTSEIEGILVRGENDCV